MNESVERFSTTRPFASSQESSRAGRRRPLGAIAAAAWLVGLGWCAAAAAEAPKAQAPPPAAAKKEPPSKPASQPAAKPITNLRNPLGNLLRTWEAEGTAAGNLGDYYDNRDRGHSQLNLEPYPQLSTITYTEEERQGHQDWAFRGRFLPHVVFGNSSTSAGVQNGGSNPRMAYLHPLGLRLLYAQYTHNNLYIYPSHLDHKPGHNGNPDYGDLYPTNTPYLLISQGSSGSDQPFMRAIPLTLAAFRPEVKKKLVEAGLVAPTLQMILRVTSKRLSEPKDYLTGKAHPPVFEGPWVDDLKMVEMAHAIRLEDIPPMIQLRAVEEDPATIGRDYFESEPAEQLGDTPAVIARVHRRSGRDYRIVVSAEGSYDVNKRPLKFSWVVLQGDAARIHLAPRGPAGARYEITAGWHPRRPVAEGSPMESNRVDIGVFAHNGKYYSAPGLVTFFYLDDEARTYGDDGRALEIGYGLGTTDVSVPDWKALLSLLKPEADGLAAKLLKKAFSSAEIAALLPAADQWQQAHAAAEAVHAKSKQVDKKAEALVQAARKADEAADKVVVEVLNKKRDNLKLSVKESVTAALAAMAVDPVLYELNAKAILTLADGADAGRKAALAAARRRLVKFGLLADGPPEAWELRPLREGLTPADQRLTRYERALLEQFHAEILGRLIYPGIVNFSTRRIYVDKRLMTPRTWRDVYHYDPKGECLGWTRYDEQGTTRFNAEGLVVVDRASEKDLRGRAKK